MLEVLRQQGRGDGVDYGKAYARCKQRHGTEVGKKESTKSAEVVVQPVQRKAPWPEVLLAESHRSWMSTLRLGTSLCLSLATRRLLLLC